MPPAREAGAGHSGKAQLGWNLLDWTMDELQLILTRDKKLSAGVAVGPQSNPRTLRVQRDQRRGM